MFYLKAKFKENTRDLIILAMTLEASVLYLAKPSMKGYIFLNSGCDSFVV